MSKVTFGQGYELQTQHDYDMAVEAKDAMSDFLLQRSCPDQRKRQLIEFLNSENSLVARIFGSRSDGTRKKFAMEELETMHKTDIRFLELYGQLAIQIAASQANAAIKSFELHNQKKQAQEIINAVATIIATITANQKAMVADIADNLREAEQYKDLPQLYEMYCQSLHSTLRQYIGSCNALMEQANEVIRKEKIKIGVDPQQARNFLV